MPITHELNLKPFPLTLQLDAMDCGPSCLRMVARYYGRSYTIQTLRQRSFITREGVSMLGISDAAESIGFHTSGIKIAFEQLCDDVPLPCIAHWNQNHFVVVYRIKKHSGGKYTIYVADPAHGLVRYNKDEFMRCWGVTKMEGKDCGTVLALQPGPEFYDMEDERKTEGKNIGFFFRYLRPYKSQLVQLVMRLQ